MSDVNAAIIKEADMNELKKLQQRLNHESIRHQFKKKVVGGLDEDDVTKYIEDIEGKFKKLEQEYKKATDDFYSLRNTLTKELQEKDSLLNYIDELKQNLNDYIEISKEKDAEINSLNEKVNSQHLMYKDEIQRISDERNELKRVLNESTIKGKQIEEYAIIFENENAELKEIIAQLENENIQIDRLKSANIQLTDEQKELKKQLNDNKIVIEQLKEHSVKYINENVSLKSKLSGLEIENAQMSEQRNDLIRQMNDTKSYVEQLTDKAEKLENENSSMKSKLSGLESENERLNTEILQLQVDNIRIEDLQQENMRMTEEIKAFEELLNQSSFEYEQLKESIEKYKNENLNLEAQIAELNNKTASKDYKINELNRVCEDLKEQLEIEKSCSEKLNMDLAILKQKIISLEGTITEKLIELEELRKAKEKAEQDLSYESAKLLNYKINGFKEEFIEVIAKIEKLEEEARKNLNSSTFLHQQLAIEQKRADKAESDLQAFMQLLNGVKDKFYSERSQLGDQIMQLVETQMAE
jgi:chromosome segregation ATPase